MRVALHFQSNRISTVRDPLEAVGVETVELETHTGGYDVIICDSPGLVSDHIGSKTPVVLRLRGNMWADGGHSRLEDCVRWTKDQLLRYICDGVATPDQFLDDELRRRMGIETTAAIGLPVTPAEWPTVDHSASALRCLTLTNFDYGLKIEPLYQWADVVEDRLGNGERWRICGDGELAADFAQHVSDYRRVDYCGFQDAAAELADANLLLHPSQMDIQMPNAILEGIAANLPVVTNNFEPFVDNQAVSSVAIHELPPLLSDFRDAARRRQVAAGAGAFVADAHAPARIGNKYRSFLERFV